MAERPVPPAATAAPSSQRLLDRLLAPKVVFTALALLLVVALLLSPGGLEDETRGSLSTHGYDPGGARGWYEGSERLGWKVTRVEERFRGTLDSTALYIVLAPQVEPTAAEVGALLTAVRRGAGLIVSPSEGSALADSLRMYSSDYEPFGYRVTHGTWSPAERTVLETTGADDEEDDAADAEEEAGDSVGSAGPRSPVAGYDRKVRFALATKRPYPRDTVVFLGVAPTSSAKFRVRPAVIGFGHGEGRIIAVADPWIVRNGMLDKAELVVLPQRMLEWAAPSPTARVVFDEYHHGRGRHASMLRVVRHALGDTPVGRAVLQIMAAGLILLIATAARPIAPRPTFRVERRSPFEHVGALARAYSQIGATRLAARRLVRGVRRRHAAGVRLGDDTAFLRRIAIRHPSLAPAVERLVAATLTPLPPRDFTLLADDIDSIERTLTT